MTKQPSYRFVGYTESWVEKKLGEIIDINSGESPAKFHEGYTPYVKVDDLNYCDKYLTTTKTYVDTNNKVKKIEKGSIVFPKRGAAILTNKIRILNTKAYMDTNMMSLSTDKSNLEFLYTVISNVGLYKIADTSTIPQINNKHILPYIISLPSLPEQTAIGSFFQDIDQLISLQQRKLEVLKEQKKTYLKLLFPAKGQTKPALRFAGFEDDWKEVKLGEVGETYTGLSGKTKEDFGHGEGKFITYVNVFNNPLTDLYRLDSVEIDDKQRRVQYGDVLFTTSSETPEDVGLSSVWMGTEDNVYLNSFCFGYRPQKGIFDLYYLAFVLRSFSVRKEFMLLAQGISRFNISKTKVMDMSIHVPSLPEQEAIGSFFQDLDKAIAKQEEKANQLKESKQTLLRKMFI